MLTGRVTLDGQPAPSGTLVRALDEGGVVIGETRTGRDGLAPDQYRLDVSLESSSPRIGSTLSLQALTSTGTWSPPSGVETVQLARNTVLTRDIAATAQPSGPLDPETALRELTSRGLLLLASAAPPGGTRFGAYVPGLPADTLTQIEPHGILALTLTRNARISVSGRAAVQVAAETPTFFSIGPVVSVQVISGAASTSAPQPTVAPQPTPRPTPTPSVTNTPEATPTPTPTATAPPNVAQNIAFGRDLRLYEGSGSETTMLPFVYADVGGSPVIFDINYQGRDSYKIFVVDSVGQDYERLLTADRPTGPYEGMRALSYRDNTFEDHEDDLSAFKIRVEGDGAWTVRVGLPQLAATPITTATGTGDMVIGPFNLTGTNPSTGDFIFEVTHAGAKFSARLIAWDGTPQQLIPPQTSSFTNRRRPVNVYASGNADKGPDDLPYGSYVLAIQADGPWTVRLVE